jgi:hypothetical protein
MVGSRLGTCSRLPCQPPRRSAVCRWAPTAAGQAMPLDKLRDNDDKNSGETTTMFESTHHSRDASTALNRKTGSDLWKF